MSAGAKRKPASPARPVQLQVNNSGAWKTVTRWDAGDDEASGMAHDAVALLGAVDPNSTWRIASVEQHPVVLKYWSAAEGWRVEGLLK